MPNSAPHRAARSTSFTVVARRRGVDFEAVFAGVAGARDEHVGNAGHRAPGEPVVLDRGQIDLGQLLQRLKRARALQRQLRVVAE
jgi:hypothetical protein